ncbi:hypothetical protein D9758_012621 [Tetrapyrgos nigripes]|uniref:Heterokaryon incompatibility domain-containing protein n=1 Tax=Tetrapyrgos nigripes TaxID=182062 RepID=A0A8H5LMZ0_9AGAR|nr:hypothetical protein D9758_012621 [Tetrapyrgos nigripes]
MRLLNTRTLRVREFFTYIPRYAILSHTWEDEEVTFQDIQNIATLADTCNGRQLTFDDIRAFLPPAQLKKGYKKIVQACVRARNSAFDWIWIDSCCINKESSAELSEAINSMYQYYENAAVCYVYLFDVSGKLHPKNPRSDFKRSKWFTRGWTLQELLASEVISFFDRDWTKIGTRWSLRDVISVVTTIPINVLEGRSIDEYSVAQKMSWAAHRQTTRPEDEAYCLMGIFGVSMSPIYGEGGEKAFMRLQQEIIRVSDDRSIFAWISKQGGERGLLARSPYEFRHSGRVRASNTDAIIGNSPSSYSFNNNGLHIHLPLETDNSYPNVFLASLNCQTIDDSYVSVYLRRTTGDYYERYMPEAVVLRPAPPPLGDVRELTVREEPILRKSRTIFDAPGTTVVSLLPSARHFVCSRPPREASISTEFSVELENSWWKDINLTYAYPSEREAFTLDFARFGYFGFRGYSLRIGDKIVDSIVDTNLHADYMLGPLPNSCFISVCLELRGDKKMGLEVDYFSSEDSRSEGVATTVAPDLDFSVPSKFKSYDLEEEECRNPEPFRYVTVPHSDFLVLKYTKREKRWKLSLDSEIERRDKREEKGTEQGGPPTCYVAVGCHQLMPWTHITFNGKSTDDLRDNLVEDERLDRQTSATANINNRKLRVQIGPATKLSRASHQLHFEWVKDESDADDEKELREGTGE